MNLGTGLVCLVFLLMFQKAKSVFLTKSVWKAHQALFHITSVILIGCFTLSQ